MCAPIYVIISTTSLTSISGADAPAAAGHRLRVGYAARCVRASAAAKPLRRPGWAVAAACGAIGCVPVSVLMGSVGGEATGLSPSSSSSIICGGGEGALSACGLGVDQIGIFILTLVSAGFMPGSRPCLSLIHL